MKGFKGSWKCLKWKWFLVFIRGEGFLGCIFDYIYEEDLLGYIFDCLYDICFRDIIYLYFFYEGGGWFLKILSGKIFFIY